MRTNRTDWFSQAGFGIFVHWTPASLPEKGEQKSHSQAIKDFDVDGFVAQVVQTDAKFVFFTITHAEMRLPFSLAELDEIVPNHTSERDLIEELYQGLDKHGIKLCFYFNGDGAQDPEWNSTTLYREDPKAHAEYCYDIARAISRKYEKKVHGWWIDCCYVPGRSSGYGVNYDFKRYADALRAGNKDAIVAFNFSGAIMPWECEWGRGISDYQAGEENDIEQLPESRFSGEGDLQWFGLCWMDQVLEYEGEKLNEYWVHERKGTPTPVYSNEKVLSYIKAIKDKGGVFAYNVALYQEGHISEPTMEQLRWLKANWTQSDQ